LEELKGYFKIVLTSLDKAGKYADWESCVASMADSWGFSRPEGEKTAARRNDRRRIRVGVPERQTRCRRDTRECIDKKASFPGFCAFVAGFFGVVVARLFSDASGGFGFCLSGSTKTPKNVRKRLAMC
jgi:hypothetical protein